MRGALVFAACIACGASPPRVTLVVPDGNAEPLHAAPGLGVLMFGCKKSHFGMTTVGDELAVVSARIVDGRAQAVVVGETSGTRRELAGETDVSDVALSEVRATASSWSSIAVTLTGSCAPNLEAAGDPIHCDETTLTLDGARVTATSEWVDTGAFVSPPAQPPPPGWEKEYAAWKKTSGGSCVLAQWSVVQDDLVLVRTTEDTCPFGIGALMRRKGGTLEVAMAAGEDGNLAVVDAHGTKYVAHGADTRFDSLWRVRDATLEPVALPGVMNEIVAIGSHVWALEAMGAVRVVGSDARTVDACPGSRATTLAPLAWHAFVQCEDGTIAVIDAGFRAARYVGPADAQWTRLTLPKRNEAWLIDDEHGMVLQTGYAGGPIACP